MTTQVFHFKAGRDEFDDVIATSALPLFQSLIDSTEHSGTTFVAKLAGGDSFTRRSIFDAGCMPVFFHPDSAYSQFVWHLPRKYISEIDVRRGNVSIESVLRQIPTDEVLGMREEVIQDPRQRLESMQDSFNVAVEAVIDMRTALLQGKDDDELKGGRLTSSMVRRIQFGCWQSQAGRKKQ
ncbi:xyloglucan galactosyltransferase KATAMARI1 homolog [Selaginella moellendorffii]|uniref:xyloglucan galactosyltransferase KATAMARI1 homolog n=1 Tax=Selaginella moellendorffii TaxID=88036 RepID=UPI000D1D04EC|nr:xyloglucan galactosyltransferase KATAMARI1 homolog [Selaginella moellendorffii]|eukprot:XP_024519984.1 xyloglucan galactosyltransferase KATAMARI1 homolog [Selaginella moellendorffii]